MRFRLVTVALEPAFGKAIDSNPDPSGSLLSRFATQEPLNE